MLNPVSGKSILELGALEVVRRIREGELGAEAYVGALLQRCHALRDLNAVITVDDTRALQQARIVDRARRSGKRLGTMAGLPFVIKDQIDVAGYPTTMGHTLFKSYIPDRNAAIVDRLLDSGGIVLAKTNCGPMVGGYPGRAMSAATNNNPYFGPARNPYDPSRMSGGSSGGNAVAIAACFAPAGIGEDTGGSIRIPSAFCGIAGLRPSTFTIENALAGTRRKRYPDLGIVPPPGYTETAGPMARTVSDVAFIDASLTGEATEDVPLEGTRIGIPDSAYWDALPSDPGVQETIRSVFARLSNAGAKLVEVDITTLAALGRAAPLPLGKPADALATWLARHVPEITVDDVERLPRQSPSVPPAPAVPLASLPTGPTPEEAAKLLSLTSERYLGLLRSHGLAALAFPSQRMPAPIINVHEDRMDQQIEVDGQWVSEFEMVLSNTLWGASIGAPSLNVPVGLTGDLPVGLLLQGAPGDDQRILGLGVSLEELLGPMPLPLI